MVARANNPLPPIGEVGNCTELYKQHFAHGITAFPLPGALGAMALPAPIAYT